MMKKLLDHEIGLLSAYRFASNMDSSAFFFSALDLLKPEKLQTILMEIQNRLKAPDLKVAASLLIKRYGFFAVINMYSMSMLNIKFNSNLENISFQEKGHTGWMLEILYKDNTGYILEADREKAREEVCKETFALHLHLIIDILFKETKLPKQIMWENIATYIFWLYENLQGQYKGKSEEQTIRSDFHYLINEAPGRIFHARTNPFRRFYTEKKFLQKQEKFVRVRKTCCLSHMLDTKQTMCAGCPHNRSLKKVTE
ncbi:IucA/IucC family C-terminal-domain containing protein [Peribacillus sp. SCS-155]|uniref:IucA/IucC family C-terminal-domain containing protein n=1 Tax=Peribacillus sedimenti TaxID=3115297 RepID=UPI003905FE1C